MAVRHGRTPTGRFSVLGKNPEEPLVTRGRREDPVSEKESVSRIVVRVTPRAASDRILPESGTEGALGFRVWVTAAPEKGKANREVLRLVAQEIGVPPSNLVITRGAYHRTKTISIRQ